jgi:phospholipid-translocating ATPase
MDVERFLRLDGYTDPHNTISNAVNNQKYNIINFLPLVLFNQFKLFFNFFQLAINLSQFVPLLKVGIYFFYNKGFYSLICLHLSWS